MRNFCLAALILSVSPTVRLSAQARPWQSTDYYRLTVVSSPALSPDARARAGVTRSFQKNNLFPDLTVRESLAVAVGIGVGGAVGGAVGCGVVAAWTTIVPCMNAWIAQ